MQKRTVERSMFYNASPEIFKKAEELRKNMTKPEKILWERLKKSQLGFRFKAQHPIQYFIADFYCHKLKLVIEVDGDNHNYQTDYDNGRTAEMEKFGISVIRFTNKEVLDDLEKVVNRIKEFLIIE